MYFKNKKVEMMTNFIFLDFKITAKVTVPMNFKKKKKKMLAPWKKSYDKPRQHLKKQRHCFADKDLYSQNYGFSSSDTAM